MCEARGSNSAFLIHGGWCSIPSPPTNQVVLYSAHAVPNPCLEPWAHEMWDSIPSAIQPCQPNGPKYKWSAQHHILQGERIMDVGYRRVPGATTWLQCPEYDMLPSVGWSAGRAMWAALSWGPWAMRAEHPAEEKQREPSTNSTTAAAELGRVGDSHWTSWFVDAHQYGCVPLCFPENT